MLKDYNLPAEDVNDDFAVITDIFFDSGDKVCVGDLIYTFETTKTVKEVESNDEGIIKYYIELGQEVEIGTLVCRIASTEQELEEKNGTVESKQDYQLTKKANALAEKHGLDVSLLPLKGIIREKDLIAFVDLSGKAVTTSICKVLDKDDPLVKECLEVDEFKSLSSFDKIEKYRNFGHLIGDNVNIREGAVLIGNKIEIGDNVTIDKNSYIEAPEIEIGSNTSIGESCNVVGSVISIGEFNTIADRVVIDISGGRYPDSDFVSGKGCLLASEVYVNICRSVKLGDNVALSPRAMIFSHSYWQSVLDGYSSAFGPVEFEDDSWLGAASQILPNVRVGEGSIVMSGSVVTSIVESFSMVGGVPAITVKQNIKKDYGHSKQWSILKKLFLELQDRLAMVGYTIKKEGELGFEIRSKGVIRTCHLINESSKLDRETLGKIDIVIVLSSNGKNQMTNQTILNIKNKTIVGTLGEVEKAIVEFYRRKGIRFFKI